MSTDQTTPSPPIDPYELLMVVRNPDGTLTRNFNLFPDTPPSSDPDQAALSKDIPINPSKNTFARIYLPRQPLDYPFNSKSKLPLIVYYHGGGFILMTAASNIVHEFCSNMAAELPAVVVSVEYRPCPEHRLPAAYVDAVEALHWVKSNQDSWLTQNADYGNCYLMGTSAGGNITYHAGLRAAAEADDLGDLKIRGLILHHPFFGGVERCESEVRLANDQALPPVVCDVMWELSLPVGVDRDHEYCNPTVGGGSKLLEKIKLLGWRVLVTGCDGDPLICRQIELAKLMEENGIQVVSRFSNGDSHGVEMLDLSKAKILYTLVKNFMI